MIFQRIIVSSLLLGLLAGLVLSLMQLFFVTPIIISAEAFEIIDQHDHGSHHAAASAEEEDWAPEDGAERATYTVASSILAAIGYAAVLLALSVQLFVQNKIKLSPLKGLLWGLCGFFAFFLLPAIGMPPEIPGVEAPPVEYRQLWWVLAAICGVLGCAVLFLMPLKFKVASLGLFIVPFLVGAPHHQGPMFAHPDPDVVAKLEALHQQFIIASGLSNLAFWLVLGVASAILMKLWLTKGIAINTEKDSDEVAA